MPVLSREGVFFVMLTPWWVEGALLASGGMITGTATESPGSADGPGELKSFTGTVNKLFADADAGPAFSQTAKERGVVLAREGGGYVRPRVRPACLR
ncbi:hypothetical protein AB0D49_38085 [Streptomyces sp. NPDC048290]|uniref:hypothetical protein n=1 Tax=Streptomyces sp. NPDC048290 TaxID=3155811 RepID=UPI00344834A3